LVDLFEYVRLRPPGIGQRAPLRERRMLAFVVRPDAELHAVELGPVEPLARAVDRWRRRYGARAHVRGDGA